MNLAEIQHAIETLSQDEQTALASWMAERDQAVWNDELENDFASNGVDTKWIEDIKAQIREGKSRPISEGPPRP